MTVRKPIVLVPGKRTQLPAGDTIDRASVVSVPRSVPYARAVTLDCAAYDHFAFDPLQGDVVVTLAGLTPGEHGVMWIPQGAGGQCAVTFQPPYGYAIRQDVSGTTGAAQGAFALTRYTYRVYAGAVDIESSVRISEADRVTFGAGSGYVLNLGAFVVNAGNWITYAGTGGLVVYAGAIVRNGTDYVTYNADKQVTINGARVVLPGA